jgi:hypothetical protein
MFKRSLCYGRDIKKQNSNQVETKDLESTENFRETLSRLRSKMMYPLNQKMKQFKAI